MKIAVQSLTKRYGTHMALDGASFATPADAGCLVLLGPSGSGKSTLLRVLGSLLTPDAGEVALGDERLAWNEADTLRQRRENGFVFQGFNLFPHLSALENVALPLRAVHTRTDEDARRTALDTLKTAIDSLERRYVPRSTFLDKARYPQTFAGTMEELRDHHLMSYDRTYLIQTQGVRISDLESQISTLSLRLDTLTIERNKLFQDLAESKRSVAAMRETIRKLATNLQAKDRLLFAMVDSIFIPYGKDLSRVGDMQKEAISHKLEQANVVTRVYDIASDNVTFLEATQLQGKDYAAMMDQYATFSNRWKGLREKMVAVASAPTPSEPGAAPAAKPKAGMKGTSITTAPVPKPAPGSEVDSILAVWNERMQKTFWTAIQKEFTDKGIPVTSFSDARTFSESIRSYVQMAKTSGEDPSVFVNEVWKARIDKEWRDALTKDAMLGKTEYAALDKLVLHALVAGSSPELDELLSPYGVAFTELVPVTP